MIKIIVGLAIAAQLFIPAAMIARYQSTLDQGTSFRFNVRPVDPVDPFRGRYVHLRFEQDALPFNGEGNLNRKDFAYASITNNDEGLAIAVELFADKPTQGDFIKVKVGYRDQQDNYYFNYIFDRYYATEEKAPEIENVLRGNQAAINDEQLVVAHIKIKDGLGVIEELYVDDLTIHEYLRNKK